MKSLSYALLCSSLCLPLSADEMHEWGTFTTVSGSDGRLLTGLHIEEEHLPRFVHSHVGMAPGAGRFMYYSPSPLTPQTSSQILVRVNGDKHLSRAISKGMLRRNISNVTVKMETPVIYFYGDDTPKVNVKVGFNGGTISQWYPQRKSGDTPHKVDPSSFKMDDSLRAAAEKKDLVLQTALDFSKPYTGAIEWDVEILPKSQADPAFTFKPEENYTWIYPRVPDTNMLKVGDEYEDYLFYRGIGNFSLPAEFSVDSNETLHVKNNSKEAIPFAFAFENIAGKFRYKTIGSIDANKSGSVTENQWITPKNPQVEVFQEMRKGLVAQGLSIDEANGMVKTWWKSYFNKPGLRVFWVVPQYDLEKILPLTLTPSPEKSVRVIVGRADVLRPKFEQAMVATIGTRAFSRFSQDRFYLPYKNRLEQLVTEPVFTRFNEQEIANTSLLVTAKNGNSSTGQGLQFRTEKEVNIKDIGLKGAWKITGDNSLVIGEVHFKLDPKTGLLSADAPKSSGYDRYEIQLNRVLN